MNIRKFITNKKSLIVVLGFFFTSCSTITIAKEDNIPDFTPNSLSTIQKQIITTAINSIDMNYSGNLSFKNKNFSNDCSGFIYGVFWTAGIDLIKEISRENGNGVKRLYKVMNKKGFIHKNKLPNPGDLIFWNNTYGVWGNNPLSHIGIVVSVDYKTGQIEYVHNNTYLGAIKKERMNLYKPHDKRPINNYMRYDRIYKKTSAELFDSFGMAWKL